MEIENDDIYRYTELTKEGKKIDIVRIGDVFLYKDSLEDKIYKIITEEELDILITCTRSE
ncbi:MAG TPA: hypothetical protein VFC79_10930 [Tissierellaceae bacterium]|nr:hypothetical protein [Tissierellaceae bacterium]